jgi:L-alanine-DL-glutamate epimerase-like enolase superfamily enzyme
MKITGIRTYAITLPVRSDYFIVSAAGAHPISRYVLLALDTDAGLTGWGEASVVPIWSGESQGGALALIQDYLAPLLQGREPEEVNPAEFDGVVLDNPFTKAAVEMALLDLRGQASGQPVYELLGGAKNPKWIPIKFSIGLREPEETAELAAAKVREGFTAIKIKVGKDAEKDLRRVQAVREAIGPGVRLNVDANGGWSVEAAIREIRRYEPFNLDSVEQPTPRWDIDGMAKVRASVGLPIMADESVFSVWQAEEVLRKKAADIISIYPGKNGGLLNSQRICQKAAEAGVACHLGSNLEWDLGTSAMCHLAVACANVQVHRFPAEILGPLYYAVHPTQAVQFERARVRVPEGPGLGVKLDAQELECLSDRRS